MARLTLFEKEADYEAFERVVEEAHDRVPLRLLDFTIMPNHWHYLGSDPNGTTCLQVRTCVDFANVTVAT